VLCADEKSRIQALDRTGSPLPLRPGLPGSQMHDYKGYGTSTQFVAFNILNGKVIGHCQPHSRGRELVDLLGELEKEEPLQLGIHPIMVTRHNPKSGCPALAQVQLAPPIPFGLHPHRQLLARSGGGSVCTAHGAHESARNLPKRH